jgi:hypothetical protein
MRRRGNRREDGHRDMLQLPSFVVERKSVWRVCASGIRAEPWLVIAKGTGADAAYWRVDIATGDGMRCYRPHGRIVRPEPTHVQLLRRVHKLREEY